MTGALEFTGERFIPGVPGEIWYEHWHRYHFAASLVALSLYIATTALVSLANG